MYTANRESAQKPIQAIIKFPKNPTHIGGGAARPHRQNNRQSGGTTDFHGIWRRASFFLIVKIL
jgi:hypothetical protein